MTLIFGKSKYLFDKINIFPRQSAHEFHRIFYLFSCIATILNYGDLNDIGHGIIILNDIFNSMAERIGFHSILLRIVKWLAETLWEP